MGNLWTQGFQECFIIKKFHNEYRSLKKFKKNDKLNVKILEIKDDKIRFSKRALDKDPLDWFKDNKKKSETLLQHVSTRY